MVEATSGVAVAGARFKLVSVTEVPLESLFVEGGAGIAGAMPRSAARMPPPKAYDSCYEITPLEPSCKEAVPKAIPLKEGFDSCAAYSFFPKRARRALK